MRQPNGRIVERRPARLVQPVTEVRVLPIHEEPWVKAVDRCERLTTNHHAGAADPIDWPRRRVSIGGNEVSSGPAVAGPDARQPRRPSGESGGDGWERA